MRFLSIFCMAALVLAGGVRVAVAQPDSNLDPTFGAVALKSGFKPDPFKKELSAGGSFVTSIGGVNAQIGKAPDFRLDYTNGNTPLTFAVESKGETTLLIRLPNGNWVANADGLRGQIVLDKPESGRYDIFVGAIGKGTISATLIIAEAPRAPLVGKGNLPDCYILSAGVDHFVRENKLRGCLNDARDVTTAFRAQAGTVYRKVEHETMLAESARRGNILEAIQNFSQRGFPGDYMVLFLAGHGGLDPSDKSWFYTPFNFSSAERFNTAITDEQILSAADKLAKQKKKVVIILDCCHSGKLQESAKPLLNRYKDPEVGGLILMSACSAAQESVDFEDNGAFTFAFKEAMTAASDINKDGKITLEEIEKYAKRRTIEVTAKKKHRQDAVIVWSPSMSKDTVLAVTRPLKFPAKKFEAPKLPAGFGNTKWDVTSAEERCAIISFAVDPELPTSLLLVLDLKEDVPQPLRSKLVLSDADGVKTFMTTGEATPLTGKRGGRIRIQFTGALLRLHQEEWAKASEVKLVLE